MKVDTINTKYGDIEVEYSTFTKGFFIKQYPDKFQTVTGLKLLKSRDNSFKEFSKLQDYVKELVHNAQVDFEFNRRVIIYKINVSYEYRDGLEFEYLVCDESIANQKYCGKENQLNEYIVIDSNLVRYIGQRNILGQIISSDKEEYVLIDYDEKIHNFFKLFTFKFHLLQESLVDFFDKDKVVNNILNSKNPLMLMGH